jgi:hypothetical protein
LLLVSLARSSSAAAADEDPEALIRQGIALRKAGDDAKAQGYFRRAYDLARTPRSAAQLGLVEFALELWEPSAAHLAESLRAKDDAWIKANRATLETSLGQVRSHLGCLVISGSPPGARVSVSGIDRGALPLSEPVCVPPGPVSVRVTDEGYAGYDHMVLAKPGQVQLEVTLLPPRAPEAQAPAGAVEESAPPDGQASSWMRPAAWGTGLGAVALLATGGLTFFAANEKYREFNNHLLPASTTQTCNKQLPMDGSADCQRLLSTADRYHLASVVGLAAGAVAAVGSATLFVLSSKSSSSGVALSCVPDFSLRAGASCAMRF